MQHEHNTQSRRRTQYSMRTRDTRDEYREVILLDFTWISTLLRGLLQPCSPGYTCRPSAHISQLLPRLSTTPAAPSRGELPRPPYPASPPYRHPLSCAATLSCAASLCPAPRHPMYILCRHPNPRRHSISFAATLRRHPILHHHPDLRCSCQPPSAPPAQERPLLSRSDVSR